MNIRTVAAFISMVVSTIAMAQTSTPKPTGSTDLPEITGRGKIGYPPKFAGSSQINDSAIIQSSQGNIRNRNQRSTLPDAHLCHE